MKYFNGEGKYQTAYELAFDTYVPDRGHGDTVYAECLRCASRLTHEFYNNGNGNAQEGCNREFYLHCIDFLHGHIDDITKELIESNIYNPRGYANVEINEAFESMIDQLVNVDRINITPLEWVEGTTNWTMGEITWVEVERPQPDIASLRQIDALKNVLNNLEA